MVAGCPHLPTMAESPALTSRVGGVLSLMGPCCLSVPLPLQGPFEPLQGSSDL